MDGDGRKLFGEKIVKARKRLGQKQADLADASGLSLSALKCYELGTRHPKRRHFEAIARALGVRPEALDDYGIETDLQSIHALFQMEGQGELAPVEVGGRAFLCAAAGDAAMQKAVRDWAAERGRLDAGEIDEREYDRWKDSYTPYATVSAATGREMPDPFTGKTVERRANEHVPAMVYQSGLLSDFMNPDGIDIS